MSGRTDLPLPRAYWLGLSDDDLAASAAEYRTTGDPYLEDFADRIDDDLKRRAAYRRALEGAQ